MTHSDFILFLLQLGIMLVTALLGGLAMRVVRQPAVLGELIGGLLLGPSVAGLLAPDLHFMVFPQTGATFASRDGYIRIGMLFFLFTAGLEVNLARMRLGALTLTLTTIFGTLIPIALGAAMIVLFPLLWSRYTSIPTATFALFMGTVLSISALPIIARILMDLDLLHAEVGSIVIGAATVSDLVGWTLFTILLTILSPAIRTPSLPFVVGGILGGIIMIWLGARLIRPLARWALTANSGTDILIGVVTVLILGMGLISEIVGIHAAFGAYLLGAAFSQRLDKRNPAYEVIHRFAVGLFAPLYFVSIGLRANFVTAFDPWLVLIVLLTASLGKIGGASFGALLGKMHLRDALAVGFGLNARGAMEIILASIALEFDVITEPVFVALVIMALVTSLISAPALHILTRRSQD